MSMETYEDVPTLVKYASPDAEAVELAASAHLELDLCKIFGNEPRVEIPDEFDESEEDEKEEENEV